MFKVTQHTTPQSYGMFTPFSSLKKTVASPSQNCFVLTYMVKFI
ncbi:hypothetical protein HMPREF9413_1416 [Paenibacillus sp. HGF7]|nr:hypothetical protein HMPREF9413_1416 [Paenibacillus sp. HGF7]EPD90106.1 hypothetical protein HMPREF1207_01375 [Paenibacillus sp. HGH0039]